MHYANDDRVSLARRRSLAKLLDKMRKHGGSLAFPSGYDLNQILDRRKRERQDSAQQDASCRNSNDNSGDELDKITHHPAP